MVQAGWALAYIKYSSAYRRAEDDARIHKRGLWEGAFIAPWDWRDRNNNTQILGAFSVPKDSQPLLIPRSATADAPSPECLIKGNVSKKNGERIYHTRASDFIRGSEWILVVTRDGFAPLRKTEDTVRADNIRRQIAFVPAVQRFIENLRPDYIREKALG